MYQSYFFGKTKKGYNAVCFKINPGNFYTCVEKDGEIKVYDDYTTLTAVEVIPDIIRYEKALKSFFEDQKNKIEAAAQKAKEIKERHQNNLKRIGNNAHNIAGYLFANKMEASRSNIPNGLKVKEVKDLLRTMDNLRYKRFREKVLPKTRQERIRAVLPHLLTAASTLPNSGYSMGETKKIMVGDHVVSYYDNRKYYNSHRYKERHGEMILQLTISEARNTRVIGGLITIVGELVGNGLRRCEWIMSGSGYNNIQRVSGYLAGDYHFHAASLKEAKEKSKIHYKEIREAKAKERQFAYALKRKDTRTWVIYEDSRNGGNCESGTKAFAAGIDFSLSNSGAIRADFLLKKATEKNVVNYAMKAINSAKLRYVGIN